MSTAALEKGNWRKFDSFAWHDRPDDCEEWAIVYTHNRDSDSVARANAEVIAELMAPHVESGDAREEHHSHWACGWVDGYAIRANSPAADTWEDIQRSLENYPLLDDEVHSRIESEDIDESWECWARREFERELEKQFGDEINIPADKLRGMFDEWAEWQHDSSGPYVNVARVVGFITADDIREYCVVRAIKVYRNGAFYCGGTLQYDEWAADCPLDETEFAVCVVALIEGAASVEFDGTIWTWEEHNIGD